MDEYQVEPMAEGLARDTQAKYVCSQCWGGLYLELVKGTTYPNRSYRALCARCGATNTKGYVTMRYANRAREISEQDLSEVMYGYRRLFEKPRTREQSLKELGF